MHELFIRGIRINWQDVDRTNWLHTVPALTSVSELAFTCPVTFLAGENGTGKSTFLEALAEAAGFNPEGGSKNYRFSTHDSGSGLAEHMQVIRGTQREKWGYFLRAESFFNVATMEEEYSRGQGGIPAHYHEQSHGESFLSLAENHLSGRGLYLLDEPEAALSVSHQLTLLAAIHDSVGSGSQFIIASHSPILLAYPGAVILSFDEGRVHPVQYEDTDSYRVMSLFMRDRERLLYNLLAEKENPD